MSKQADLRRRAHCGRIGAPRDRSCYCVHRYGGRRAGGNLDSPTSILLSVQLSAMIVQFALMEAAAAQASIAFLVEQRLFVLAVTAVAVLFMVVSFPTKSRVESRLQRQNEQLLEFGKDNGGGV